MLKKKTFVGSFLRYSYLNLVQNIEKKTLEFHKNGTTPLTQSSFKNNSKYKHVRSVFVYNSE